MKYQVADLVSLAELQCLMDSFHRATGINHALLDRDGRVLTAAGWKRVCTDFHRADPAACRRCQASDQYISEHLMDGPYIGYECRNGLFDYATPVIIEGEHVASIFTGQIFHAAPDLDRFGRQAEEFGFDREDYLEAVQEVEITPRERMPEIMDFLVRLARDLGTKGLSRLRQLEAEEQLRQLNAILSQRVEERTVELTEANRLLREKEERLEQNNQQLQRLNRTLLLLSDSNTVLIQADNEEVLLPDICRLIVEKGGYPLAWVGFAEADAEKTVRPVASWGRDSLFQQDLEISWDDTAVGRGPSGCAIRTGKTQVIQDVRTDPRVAPWRHIALQEGFMSSIALPLIGDGNILGALSICSSDLEAFGQDEVRLLERLAHNLAFGIEGIRARARLATTNQELQAFTYAASHDLKAPLRGINSFSSLLESQYGELLQGDGHLFLGYIRRNASRMNVLIEDLLAYSRIDHGSARHQQVNLTQVVEAVLAERQDDIRQWGAIVATDLPAVTVEADASGLAQVWRNLLGNALKYSAHARPPRIEIGGMVDGGLCRTWVRDNGIGFDMAYSDRIFEVFRRLHTYDEYPGTGIGLALVRKAVHRMGGKVWAESAPGEGAVFYVELKLAGQLMSLSGGRAPRPGAG